MKEIILDVEGMACGGCEKRIINTLSENANIKEVFASHKDKKVKIKAEKDININEIKTIITDLGFEVK